MELEEVKLCHLGDLGAPELDAEILEKIGQVDVLFVPSGGEDVLDPAEAAKVVNLLEPKIVIPMHYQLPKTPQKGAKIEEFLHELGEKEIKPEEKFTFKKKELPEEGTKVVVLKPAISL